VGKQILATIVRGDEAKALALIEPFQSAGFGRHVDFLLKLPSAKARQAKRRQEDLQKGVQLDRQQNAGAGRKA
jgi:hypothetical protein